MKNRPLICTILGMPLIFVTINTCSAQPGWLSNSVEMMPIAFMEQEDANGDGKVTKAEFKGPQIDFAFFDANDDGIIEVSEAPTPDNLPASLHKSRTQRGKPGAMPLNVVGDGSGATVVSLVTLNGTDFNLYKKYDFFTWKELPSDVKYERSPVVAFTRPDGVTHYYEAVYVSSGN